MEASSAPLADYFWIAGVDSLSYGQHLQLSLNGEKAANGSHAAAPVQSTIDEDQPLETPPPSATHLASPPPISPGDGPTAEPSRLAQRASGLSADGRPARSTTGGGDGQPPGSNRSSATIRGLQINGTPHELDDFDFDQALKKFASERDSFLNELSFSAGLVLPQPPAASAAPAGASEKTLPDEPLTVRSAAGSIRRRISFRDLSSMKRQPSMVARTASVRTTRRLSNYNSVIPTPQPIQPEPNMHPLKRKFEPVLLDRYPSKAMVDETRRRGPFPDYVPMFAFPNDVTIVSADERPRSSWHGFAMTGADNGRLHAICLTVWLPLKPEAAQEIERQCEEWRRANMSSEERELANSLGERLAVERARLSEHLARLPSVTSGSVAREALEERIGAIEERIGLMTDLLRPVRHGAAAKIDGLTDGDTGLWIPRVYGILGRDPGLAGFWKEWLRAVAVPMLNGAVLRVPPSSPRVGMWQPLERYVVNLCAEALSPISSKTQVELAIRDLRLFARKEAVNELPGARSLDLFGLCRALTIPNLLSLFECALAESRIVLLSSHTAMLHLASRALVGLLYPLTWAGIFIPVLPARLLSALDAPCPYIVGVERRYDRIDLPDDDFVLVDLDHDRLEAAAPPPPLPRAPRRKLAALLQLAAPHHNRYGVGVGPPRYAVESYPFDAFSSENAALFSARAEPSSLARYASLSSTSFGAAEAEAAAGPARPPLVFNAFVQARAEASAAAAAASSAATQKSQSPESPGSPPSFSSSSSPSSLPLTPTSRNDSGFSLAATLREKRSGHFDNGSRRSSSFGIDRAPTGLRRPSIPFSHHASSLSMTTMTADGPTASAYAPSSYAQSTIAASTVMPNLLVQPVKSSGTTSWVEGHCLQWHDADDSSTCAVCDERVEEGSYGCGGCQIAVHSRCAERISLVCPAAFHRDQVQVAFARCFASLFYTYRKYLHPASGEQKKAGKAYRFHMEGFVKSVPREHGEYLQMLQQTQAFNEFIHDRETKSAHDPAIKLFDQIILAKRNRGRTSIFSKADTGFLQDTSDHLWRSATAMPPSSRFPGDYRQVTSRIPAKLDPTLLKEPRVIQGAPRISTAKARRKPIPSMLGLNTMTSR